MRSRRSSSVAPKATRTSQPTCSHAVFSCKESRAAVERSRRYAQNTPRIITSKIDGKVQELFYCDSSDIIILRIGCGRTGHIVSGCLAKPESDKGHFGAPPRFPKHIGLEIELDDYLWLVQWGHSPSNRSQQYQQVRYFAASIMNWVNHGATLYFLFPGNKAFTDYEHDRMKRGNLESSQIEGLVFNDGKYRYLPVLPSSCLETELIWTFITELKTLFRDSYQPDPCAKLDSSLKVMARQQISHERTTG
ncbi:hypothetical protein GQ607_005666 [Colletotrichum asianum]|uniref:Uncharacterized protein n=1 Tax=Colletotrichum asianum TaxID=702518 RepID=A0A8H3WMK5_9PEZI|nr:hypothetical protein GQ607_005666 [Colletotrichum asianum]